MPSSKKKPRTDEEANDAVRTLCDYLDDDREFVLMADKSVPVFIVPAVMNSKSTTVRKRIGRIEYQVSDGLPNERSESRDVYTLKEAVALFKKIQKEGWQAA